MQKRKGMRAVDCSNYSELSAYVSAGLAEVDEEEVPLLFDEDLTDEGEFNSGGLEDLDVLLMESIGGKKF